MEADSASSATSSGERGLWRYWWVDDNVLVKTFNLPNDPEVDWTWPEIRRVSGDTLRTLRTVGEWFFYAPGADNLLGSINPLLAQGRRHLFVRDYRGSVIQTTYETGQALGIGAGWYQPFGGQTAGSTARATEPGYNGHESSGGLVYMRNRWYDPNTGRFTQQDPIGFAGGSNLYAYTGGDPVNYSDPFGLCPIEKDDIPCTAVYDPGVTVSSERLRTSLDNIAAEQNTPLRVYGGDRSPERNAAVGGAKNSSHLRGEGADVILVGKSKRETADALYHSEARKDGGVRLLYHQPGARLPEHSHLDLNKGADVQEQPKGTPGKRYVPMEDPVKHP